YLRISNLQNILLRAPYYWSIPFTAVFVLKAFRNARSKAKSSSSRHGVRMEFARLLGILSRSSAQAVSTLHSEQSSAGSPLEVAAKNYLYVQTPVEEELLRQLEACRGTKAIIFL